MVDSNVVVQNISGKSVPPVKEVGLGSDPTKSLEITLKWN